MTSDLKKCELHPDWHEQVQDRSSWHGCVNAAAEDVNEGMEDAEQSKKDELKQRREAASQEQAQSGWRTCSEHGCCFVGRSKAGLVNHVRQKHSSIAQCQQRCPHCRKSFQKQGVIMHVRFCKDNPTRGVS